MPRLTFRFEFASTLSYLAAMRIAAAAVGRYRCALRWCVPHRPTSLIRKILAGAVLSVGTPVIRHGAPRTCKRVLRV